MSLLRRQVNRSGLAQLRRSIYELARNGKYSRPSLNNLDQKLSKYLNFRNGFFVELGANDGFSQSNTYYLEKIKGWKGILIEPIPTLYTQAVKRRPQSKVFNCACIPFDFEGEYVQMTYANLMSVVKGALKDPIVEAEHISRGEKLQTLQSYDLMVYARTITSIFEESDVNHIDFMSLDVEGYELSVLEGLDFNRYSPHYLLIEARFKTEIDDFIGDKYDVLEQWSEKDYLYRLK